MRPAITTLFLVILAPSAFPQPSSITITGKLELMDKPPEATPIEVLMFSVRHLRDGRMFWTTPDRDGKFLLENLPPGRYSLNLTFPGRIRAFTSGRRSLMPDDFEFSAGDTGPLLIVATLKTADLSVDVYGVPDGHNVIALLWPADPWLNLRESGFSNLVSSRHAEFRFVPPGSYRVFVVDGEPFSQNPVAISAAVRTALQTLATPVSIPEEGETRTTATYIPADTVSRAVAESKDTIPR